MSYAKYVLVPILRKYGALKKDGTLSDKNITAPGFTSRVVSVKKKSKPKIVNTITPKSKPVKYTSIGKSQMRSGRYSTIKTSPSLLSTNLKISKKKLLGS